MIKGVVISEAKKNDRNLTRPRESKQKPLTEQAFSYFSGCVYITSLFDEPVTLDTFVSMKDEIRLTRGDYTLKYIPKSCRRNGEKDFVIGQDLVRMRINVSGHAHFRCAAKRIPELGWLERNSTLTPYHFAIAKMHPGLPIRFTIDFPKYCDKIIKKAEAMGYDINHKPLVYYPNLKTRAQLQEGFADYNSTIKNKNYYKEMKEAEAEYEKNGQD